MGEYMCSNCATEHDTSEEAVSCCQCEDCVELQTRLEASEARALELEQTLTEIERLVGGMAIMNRSEDDG